jgi:RNase adapter protein RapZ
MKVVVISGISGSGKSVALNVLEDDGYYCIDNLPAQFLQDVVRKLEPQGHPHIAVAIDARSGVSGEEVRELLGGLARYSADMKVLFLNARDDTLIQRFSETRRRHPMTVLSSDATGQLTQGQPTLAESITRERDFMAPLQEIALSIDTSDMHPNTLRQWVRDTVGSQRAALTLLFESFAFKHGVPLNADLVFDVRCLPNPYYDPELRPLSGLDIAVANYLRAIPSVQRMVDHVGNFLNTWLPHYLQENRSYLTVALGCTGGQHRSVYCVEELARRFRRTETVLVRHRAMALRASGSVLK